MPDNGSNNHTVEGSRHKRTEMMTWALLALPALTTQRNSGSVIKKAPLTLRQHVFRLVQKGTRATTSRGRGQAYNLTAEKTETSKEVVAGKIMVHSKFVLALFNSAASHCFISDSLLHCILFLSYV